jgi:hypothetical protein
MAVLTRFSTGVVQDFEGRWFYPVTSTGQVNRTDPKKPNSRFEVGDLTRRLLFYFREALGVS